LAGSFNLNFSDAVYSLSVSGRQYFPGNSLRYSLSTLARPSTTYSHDLASGKATVEKVDEVGGGYNAEDYVVERLFADGEGGAKIPISIVRKKTTVLDGKNPCMLYGYGSYGIPGRSCQTFFFRLSFLFFHQCSILIGFFFFFPCQ
jgi:oligopeptidase B